MSAEKIEVTEDYIHWCRDVAQLLKEFEEAYYSNDGYLILSSTCMARIRELLERRYAQALITEKG